MSSATYILGINAHHAGASACLIKDGHVIAAAEEERFNRRKYWAGFPSAASRWVVESAGIKYGDIQHIGISRNPSRHLLKKIGYVMRARPSASLILERLRNAAQVSNPRAELAEALGCSTGELRSELHNVEHHRAHLASAFFVSPYTDAIVMSIDGMGDFCSTMWGIGQGNRIRVTGSILFPHSLGFFYTAISQWLGFTSYGDEGKVMALAAFGTPTMVSRLQQVIRVRDDGTFELNLDYFSVHNEGVAMTWSGGDPRLGNLYSDALHKLLGDPRPARGELTQTHYDVAASLQWILEDAVTKRVTTLHAETGITNLCLAGGVALNSMVNGRITLTTPIKRLWVQPAAGDAGTSMGVCYHLWHEVLGMPRNFELKDAGLGPEYSNAEIEAALRMQGLEAKRYDDDKIAAHVAEIVANGGIVGWFQGRMEWGPRALGHRSIVADPRRADMKEMLNSRIKHREGFRPFAPSILEEFTGEYFEQSDPDPFMVKVYKVKADRQATIPSAIHVDGTGRLQTVNRSVAPTYWRLINAFYERTGVPIIVNTSFNDNEPIVCTPMEALSCFERTNMTALAIGNHLVQKQ